MSYNQNTKINNLYQIIAGLATDISGLSVDISGLSNPDYVYAYQNSYSSSVNDIPIGGGNLYIRNFTAQLSSNFQYNGISTFTCNNSGTYILSFQNSFVNNAAGSSQSNCTIYFEINGNIQETTYDSVPIYNFSNNSQTIRKTLNSGDLIKIYVDSSSYLRILTTTLNIIQV